MPQFKVEFDVVTRYGILLNAESQEDAMEKFEALFDAGIITPDFCEELEEDSPLAVEATETEGDEFTFLPAYEE